MEATRAENGKNKDMYFSIGKIVGGSKGHLVDSLERDPAPREARSWEGSQKPSTYPDREALRYEDRRAPPSALELTYVAQRSRK